MRASFVGLAALIVLLPAAASRAADAETPVTYLEKAGEIELYSLDPSERGVKDGFHGWKVLGKTTVKDAETVKKLAAAFKKGVEENKGIAAACFNPRHGIRLTHDGKTVDLVICFECYSVQEFVADKQGKGCLVTRSPQPAFDKVLKDAGVALPNSEK
jgi:hypothetical protein